jgi:hypothetical protein
VSNSPGAVIAALLVCGLLILVMRWVFGTGRPRIRPPVDASEAELGLLTVVRTGVARNDAVAIQARLRAGGVRSSLSHRRDGTVDLLVFHDDVDRARALLSD